MESNKRERINFLSSEIKRKLKLKEELEKKNEDITLLNSEIWEISKEIYALKAQEREDLKYNGIIFSVGLTPQPIILNILAIRPKYVYFICTHRSKEQLKRIKEETGLEDNQFKVVIMEKDTTYRALSLMRVGLRYLYEEKGIPYNKIAVDITGGTKMMSVGCGIATSKFNLDLLYVSNDAYDPDKRIPEPGTEKLLVIPNRIKTIEAQIDIPKGEEKINDVLIFISYSTKDAELFKIREIAELLKKYDEIKEVIYWQEHMTGNMIEFMNKWVGKCDVLILFCSENILKSIPTTEEWTARHAIHKPIIPIFYDYELIPDILRNRLGIQFDFYDIEKNVQKIYSLILKTCKARKSV